MMTTLTPDQPSAASITGCPNCQKPDYAANGWCRFCGYYGVLGKCVDLADWEQDFVAGEFVGEKAPAEHPWIAAIKAVPLWAWQLSGVLCLITLVTLLVRLGTVPGSAYRIVGAVGLLVTGLLVTFGSHIYAGIRNMFEDPHFSLTDIAIHPLQLWCTVCLQLPRTVRRVAFLWGGVWTLILVHAVVGVPYLQLVDLSEPPPKPQVATVSPAAIAAAVMAQAEPQEYLTLEDALGQIASDLGGDSTAEEDESLSLKQALGEVVGDSSDDSALTEGDPLEQADPEADSGFVTTRLDSVIIGYTERDGAVSSLVLAVRSNGGWRVAGTVSSGFTAETLESLGSQLASIRRESPFVKTELSAKWVEPILHASIEADYSKTEDRFGPLTFLELR